MPANLELFAPVPPADFAKQLTRFAWLNEAFDTCFKFKDIDPGAEIDNCTVEIGSIEAPATFLPELCTIDSDEREMYIHFVNLGAIRVTEIRVNEEVPAAIIRLELIDDANPEKYTHLVWYGTTGEPFNAGAKGIFAL